MRAVGTSIFERLTLDKPASGSTGSLGEAVLWAVDSFAAASYLLRMATLKVFNTDILTFNGHGNLQPDGSRAGANSTTRRVSVSASRRIRRAAALEHKAVASKLVTRDADGAAAADPSNDGGSHHPSAAPGAADERRSEAAASSRVLLRATSMVVSEHVAELEQTTFFIPLDRASTCSRGVQQVWSPLLVGKASGNRQALVVRGVEAQIVYHGSCGLPHMAPRKYSWKVLTSSDSRKSLRD